jgi:dTDP-4-dehydrorhamnose reductase
MRVMVTGARGLLGAAIVREFLRDSDVSPFDHASLDVTDPEAVEAAVASSRPDLVINCAAFNAVDAAEDHAQAALAVNALAVRTLSRASVEIGSRFVHYSTDFVFDGETDRPYTEEDPAKPRSFYGLSKLLGEWFALEHRRSYVLRVESLFGAAEGARRRGSLWAILERIRAGDEVPVFVDRTVSPAYIRDVARATRRLAEIGAPRGLYHCVNSGAATWADIAAEAARLMAVPLRMRPLTLESAGLRAPRPRYCALSNAKLAAAGVPMPPWQDALARYLSETISAR